MAITWQVDEKHFAVLLYWAGEARVISLLVCGSPEAISSFCLHISTTLRFAFVKSSMEVDANAAALRESL